MGALKTYRHLEGLRRMPSEYEVLSSRLLYYTGRGFEVEMPASDWYRRHQSGSPLSAPDWEAFCDPRETTYASYAALQAGKEAHAGKLLKTLQETRADRGLSPAWKDRFAELAETLRFPCHGLQMVSAYLGSMAPSGRIVLASLFQTADELRRVELLSRRTEQLLGRRPASQARARWQSDSRWQPLRRLVERLLVVYDWGECFTALNLAVKPAFDAVFVDALAASAWDAGDPLTSQLLRSLGEDCRWHRAWSRALVRQALRARPANGPVLQEWIERWAPAAEAALAPLAARGNSKEDARPDLHKRLRSHWRRAGLEVQAWKTPEAARAG